MYATAVALTVAGKLEASVTIMLESFTAKVTFVKLSDDESEEVTSIVEKVEVKERKTMKGSCIT